MTEEEKKTEFENWQNTNIRWLHFQISIGKVGEVIEKAFIEALNIGFAYGIKTKVNTTTISDAPLMEREQLEQAKEIIKQLMYASRDCIAWYCLCDKAKQFLKEIEK